LKELLAFSCNEELQDKVPGVHSPYAAFDYPTLYHLVSHTEKMAAEELYQYSFVRISIKFEILNKLNSSLGFTYILSIFTQSGITCFVIFSFLFYIATLHRTRLCND